jgi:hypothetical protein
MADEKTTKKGRQSYSHVKADARKEKKRLEAENRQKLHNKLSIKEKITKATARGGSVKELNRLNILLVAEKIAKSKAKTETKVVSKTVADVKPKVRKGEKRVSRYRQKQAKN